MNEANVVEFQIDCEKKCETRLNAEFCNEKFYSRQRIVSLIQSKRNWQSVTGKGYKNGGIYVSDSAPS